MKIYFCGSMGGGRQDELLYGRLIKKLEKYGEVLNPIVGQLDITEEEMNLTYKQKVEIHKQDVAWLNIADAVVAEVTQTSTGVGYEIGRGIGMGKPTLCIFRPDAGKHVSAMIAGCGDDKTVFYKEYKEEDVDRVFKEFFETIH